MKRLTYCAIMNQVYSFIVSQLEWISHKLFLCKTHSIILLLSSLLFSLSYADYISPDLVKIKTAKYTPSWTAFAEGVYLYDISWQGIPVASASVEVKNDISTGHLLLHVAANVKTGSFIDIFYKLRHNSESFMERQTLQPKHFRFNQVENSRKKGYEIFFENNGFIKAQTYKNGEEKSNIEFISDNRTLDPISAAFVARSLPLELGRELSFDVFNGKHRYLINFKVDKLEEIQIGDRQYKAFKVIPTVQKLTDTEGEKRLSSAAIWVSADQDREVLKLESKVLVGKVSARMKSFIAKNELPDVHIAQELDEGNKRARLGEAN